MKSDLPNVFSLKNAINFLRFTVFGIHKIKEQF